VIVLPALVQRNAFGHHPVYWLDVALIHGKGHRTSNCNMAYCMTRNNTSANGSKCVCGTVRVATRVAAWPLSQANITTFPLTSNFSANGFPQFSVFKILSEFVHIFFCLYNHLCPSGTEFLTTVPHIQTKSQNTKHNNKGHHYSKYRDNTNNYNKYKNKRKVTMLYNKPLTESLKIFRHRTEDDIGMYFREIG
jgi:hypothetical protein